MLYLEPDASVKGKHNGNIWYSMQEVNLTLSLLGNQPTQAGWLTQISQWEALEQKSCMVFDKFVSSVEEDMGVLALDSS